MTRKLNFLPTCILLMLVLVPAGIAAATVSEPSARQKAQAFLKMRHPLATATLHAAPARPAMRRSPSGAAAQQQPFYMFNIGTGEGFVVVSGDDRTPAILGYADSGSLSPDDMPDALRCLLDGYAEQMEWLDGQPALPQLTPYKAPARTPIAPLTRTQWDQGAPYNSFCPEIEDEKTVTGCVATSMAQLMFYHQLPAVSTAIPGYSYTAEDKSKATFTHSIDTLEGTTFNWAAMTLTYSNGATGPAADAVATLMRYCGQSINMEYGLRANGGSAAYNEAIPYALKTYFGYDGAVRNTYRSCYSYPEWVDLIYGELAARRPVILGGQSTGGGHAFVCDGYQGDDYFHINWGWGGSSDGYFRLSALNPIEQGIGRSSTLDGFSYSQTATVGIQPPVDGNSDYCLSLEGLRLGSPDGAKTSKTFTRDEATGDFKDISIYFLVYNYHQGSQPFDYAVQLTDGSGNALHTFYSEEGETMVWNARNKDDNGNNGRTLTSLTIPSTLADGIYYIKVVSRPNGVGSEWQECFDGDRYQLTAVISGNELTISVPIPSATLPTGAVITLDADIEGALTQGYDQQVTATITGGDADYHGNVILRVNGTAVMGKVLDIPAGQTVEAHYAFTPTAAGDNVLTLHNARVNGTQIGSTTTVTIAESDATDKIDNLAFTATIDNQNAGGQLYGSALRATITVSNPSTTNTYAGKLYCSLRKWTITTTDNGDGTITKSTVWESIDQTTYPLKVGKNATTTIHFANDALATTDESTRYSLRISYRNSDAEGNVVDGVHLGLDENGWGALTVAGGYRLGSADGTTTIHEAADTIDAGQACFVDITPMGNTAGISVTPSTNPNCLYLLPAGADVPQGLDGKNVVKGTTAETITLTDGHDFFSPFDFTATTISYTRTFKRQATATGGWNGLYLPFDVADVTCGGKTIDWFRSDSDTGKSFWLKTMTADDDGTVFFDHADALTANTPYIIALPGEDFGEWQLTRKTITFTGSNVQIKATATGTRYGNSYKFCGSTTSQTHNDAYMLNTTGTRFIKGTATLPAFRTWIEAANISSLARQQLVIADGESQGIREAENGTASNDGQTGTLYTLDGRKVSSKPAYKKGLYISNGKKIIIR